MKAHQYLQDMATFAWVAKYRSFSLAANELNVPTSSVSRQIAAMESRLGITLFYRTSRQVHLTPMGVEYYSRVKGVMDDAQRAYHSIQDQQSMTRGLIRLSVSIGVADEYLAPFLWSFIKSYPEVDLHIDVSQRQVDIVTEGYDLALRLSGRGLKNSDLIAQPILHIRHGIFGAKDQFAYLQDLSFDTFSVACQDLPFVAIDTRQMKSIFEHRQTGEVRYLSIQPRYTLGSMSLVSQAVRQGAGMGCLGLTPTIREALMQEELISLLPDWRTPQMTLYAVTASREQPMRVKLLIGELKSFYQEMV